MYVNATSNNAFTVLFRAPLPRDTLGCIPSLLLSGVAFNNWADNYAVSYSFSAFHEFDSPNENCCGFLLGLSDHDDISNLSGRSMPVKMWFC